jgi:hypothetical protein
VLEFGRLAIALVRSVPTSKRLLVASAVLVVDMDSRCKLSWYRYPSPPIGMKRPESQRRSRIVADDDAACIMAHLDGGIRDRNNDASRVDLGIFIRINNNRTMKSCGFFRSGANLWDCNGTSNVFSLDD